MPLPVLAAVDSPGAKARSRSGFVSAIAWTFIALAGFATLIAALQNAVFTLMFSGDPTFEKLTREVAASGNMPPFAVFMFANFRLLLAGFLAVSSLTLAAAIGLLKRRNWARLAFIAMMLLGVLWNLGGIWLAFSMWTWFPPVPDTAPAEFRASFETMAKVITAVNIVVGVLLAGLFGWIARRLASSEIRQEFAA
jgi:hypothetical protein